MIGRPNFVWTFCKQSGQYHKSSTIYCIEPNLLSHKNVPVSKESFRSTCICPRPHHFDSHGCLVLLLNKNVSIIVRSNIKSLHLTISPDSNIAPLFSYYVMLGWFTSITISPKLKSNQWLCTEQA